MMNYLTCYLEEVRKRKDKVLCCTVSLNDNKGLLISWVHEKYLSKKFVLLSQCELLKNGGFIKK